MRMSNRLPLSPTDAQNLSGTPWITPEQRRQPTAGSTLMAAASAPTPIGTGVGGGLIGLAKVGIGGLGGYLDASDQQQAALGQPPLTMSQHLGRLLMGGWDEPDPAPMIPPDEPDGASWT